MPENATGTTTSYALLQRILPRHQAIKTMVAAGATVPDIALKLNMTNRNVYNIINSPTFQHELSLLQARVDDALVDSISQQADDVATIIAANTRKAAEKLGLLIESPDDAIALRAASDILDRGGYPKVTKSDNSSATVVIDEATALIIRESLSMLSSKQPAEEADHTGSKGSGNGIEPLPADPIPLKPLPSDDLSQSTPENPE